METSSWINASNEPDRVAVRRKLDHYFRFELSERLNSTLRTVVSLPSTSTLIQSTAESCTSSTRSSRV